MLHHPRRDLEAALSCVLGGSQVLSTAEAMREKSLLFGLSGELAAPQALSLLPRGTQCIHTGGIQLQLFDSGKIP